MNTATDSLETNSVKTASGYAVGQSSSDLVGFWGATPVDQPASLTAQLTTITMADTAGASPDYTLGAITTTSAAGFASIQECISFAYVVRNLQVRLAEVEARLEEAGIVASN
jgi:hypothetical protein